MSTTLLINERGCFKPIIGVENFAKLGLQYPPGILKRHDK